MRKRGSFVADNLGWLLLALLVLVVVLAGIFILTGKGQAALEYIKNLFRFGRG